MAKARTIEALDAAGGPELVSRYAASKKAELASAAERIFSGNFIGEAEVKELAQAWVPPMMRFAGSEEGELADHEGDEAVNAEETEEIAEQAA
ncbi:putative DNA-binding protein [Novosphingobium pentaromativorans US6-1]|uniref:Putative DNA-binding protein n=1 Tax=Novosphingobium pentaromativorans US6-1 TaxID=1088721 RepID=G6EDT3_9SPHN|nr:putative DNA-binding protein [Novosphingobium pentaromativorans US6-1]